MEADADIEAELGAATVNRIHVMGAVSVSTYELEALTQPYLDRPLSTNDLQALANELSEACQAKGYLLCRADIHQQDLDSGKLEVSLTEGYVERIEADPALMPVLERALAHTLRERPLREKTFRQEIAGLDEIPGLNIKSVRPRRERGSAYVLEIVGTYDRIGLRGLATNRGSRRGKPWKAFAGAEIGSILSPADRLTLGLLVRPEAIDELIFIRGRYDAAPSRRGLRPYAEFAVSNSSPRSELDGRDVKGDTLRAKSGLIFPLLRREGARIAGEVSFETSSSSEEEDGLNLYEDELHVLRTAIMARRRLGRKGIVTGQIEASKGLDVFGAGGSSRPDGEADFFKLTFAGTAARPVYKGVILRLGVDAQWADSPLLFTEEFGLGGGKFGRAYDYGEVMGDSGIASFLEIARPFRVKGLLSRAEPYIYADGGTTWNEGAGLSADGTVLWSAGGGVRLEGKQGWSLTYEAAVPLSDAPYTLEDHYVRHRLDLAFRK